VMLEGKLFVLIAVREFADQPVICTRDCQHVGGKLVLRAGAVYARTMDARCSETRVAEDMQRVLDMAVRKRGDTLLAQIAGLLGERGAYQLSSPIDERFQAQIDSAQEWFVDNDLAGPHWQVEIRPQRFVERLSESRSQLAVARDGATTTLRGWDFPHTDREDASPFADGFQSVTHWAVHHEAYRLYLSGLFVWRKLHQEDFEDDRFHGTLMFESVIWTYTEIWTFASRLLGQLMESGDAVVKITLTGLSGRTLKPSRPSVSVWPGRTAQEDSLTQVHVMSLGELRADHLEYAARDAIDLLELFDAPIEAHVVRQWQERLLNREF
jgi:hypothetical protein